MYEKKITINDIQSIRIDKFFGTVCITSSEDVDRIEVDYIGETELGHTVIGNSLNISIRNNNIF